MIQGIQTQITTDECKRDCTLDFSDCSFKCQSGGNQSSCHQSCSQIVKGCINECPKIICYDKCRVKFESCRDHEEVECGEDMGLCQDVCDKESTIKKDEI